jgi:hypothetical protein
MQQSSVSDCAIRFEDYEKLTHWLSRRLVARGQGEGVALPYGDVFQELVLVWLRCRDGFDQAVGVKFSTYYVRAAVWEYRNIKRALAGQYARHMVSLSDQVGGAGEESLDWIDVIPDLSAENPEAQVALAQSVEQEMAINPALHRLTELAANPPPELARELEALAAQAAWAKHLGVVQPETMPTALTPMMLRRLFRLNWRQRKLSLPRAEAFSGA